VGLLIKNIKSLVGIQPEVKQKLKGREMSSLNAIDGAYLLMEGDTIAAFGKMTELQVPDRELETINAEGRMVMPAWCDSHTHVVFAAWREKEFEDRIKGLSYEDIARRGGGILNSVKKLRDASEEELYDSAWKRLDEMITQGTGAVEIKSGYGLNTESELKMLRVIKRLKENHPVTIKATLLAAHAVPAELSKEKYIELIVNEIIPQAAKEKLAEYCDVFCERNYFSKEDTIKILEAGNKYGLKGKVHAEQLSHSGGIEAGVQTSAISVDHLEFADDNDIALLRDSNTMATILPGAQFFLQLQHPPVRKMIDGGCAVAISSDYNPGTAPSGNINLNIALACVQYKITPEEAINAATINSAYAMGLSQSHGSIAKGKRANILITEKMDSVAMIPYSFGDSLVDTVIINGKVQTANKIN
jgi:imidazolonepropionase